MVEEISVILTPLPKAREAHSALRQEGRAAIAGAKPSLFRISNSYPRLGFETYRENSELNPS